MINSMSTFEKLASVAIITTLVLAAVFSYYEVKEYRSGFEESLGQDFKIGSFSAVVSKESSGGPEDNCKLMRPVIITALHDIAVRLGGQKTFEVNEDALQLFCNKNAEITLSDRGGNKLILQKVPFVREVPAQGGADDIGTKVRIQATVVPAGAQAPSEPTAYAEVLIPDRFLDADDQSGR